jgi:radical SAM-linked protein
VQRLRLRYAKRGRLRFSSHRDFQRAFERALRRACVPMAFSSGFSPHPKVSYAGAAATGMASEAEYLEIAVVAACDPDRVRSALDDALPDGLDVLEVVEVSGPGALADRLEASEWRVELPGLAPAEAERAVAAFLSAEEVPVQRLMKNGPRTLDARAPVVRLELVDDAGAAEAPGQPPCAILRLVVRHVTPSVRPDDVLAGLVSAGNLAPLSGQLARRLAQGPLDEAAGTVSDPLAPDRAATGADVAGS